MRKFEYKSIIIYNDEDPMPLQKDGCHLFLPFTDYKSK